MINISPLIAIVLVLALLGGSIAVLSLLGKKYNLNPESLRKAVHIIMGCITLTFPYLFSERWPVIVLGVTAVGIMLTLRMVTSLKNGVGSVLYGVKRESLGEIFFPISVSTLFYLADGDKVLYSIPILILTFADSTAALIGSNYGRKGLAAEKEDRKSLEGAVSFFVAAFLCTLIPILLFTDIGRTETLLISLILGMLAALIELVSFGGNDNLLIPFMGYAFLVIHKDMEIDKLTLNIAGIIVIALSAYLWSKYTSLSRLGVMEGVIASYIIIVLGGWMWVFAPLVLYGTHAVLPALTDIERKKVINYHIVTTNLSVGVLWVWFASVTEMRDIFFYGFICAFGCHLSMNTFIRFHYYIKYKNVKSVILSFAKGAVFVLIPGFIFYYFEFARFLDVQWIAAALGTLLISVIITLKATKYINYEMVMARLGWINALIVFLLTAALMSAKLWVVNIF